MTISNSGWILVQKSLSPRTHFSLLAQLELKYLSPNLQPRNLMTRLAYAIFSSSSKSNVINFAHYVTDSNHGSCMAPLGIKLVIWDTQTLRHVLELKKYYLTYLGQNDICPVWNLKKLHGWACCTGQECFYVNCCKSLGCTILLQEFLPCLDRSLLCMLVHCSAITLWLILCSILLCHCIEQLRPI